MKVPFCFSEHFKTLPGYLYCKQSAFTQMEYLPKDEAVIAKYIQANSFEKKQYIILHFSNHEGYGAWKKHNIAEPCFMTINENNGHASLYYNLLGHVSSDNFISNIVYRLVKQGLTSLLGSKPLVVGNFLALNPFTNTNVSFKAKDYSLIELLDSFPKMLRDHVQVEIDCYVVETQGNVLEKQLMVWAKTMHKQFAQKSLFTEALRKHAEELSTQFHKPLSEEDFDRWNTFIVNKVWNKFKNEETEEKKLKAILALEDHSAREVAEMFGVTHPTVLNWKKEHDKKIEMAKDYLRSKE